MGWLHKSSPFYNSFGPFYMQGILKRLRVSAFFHQGSLQIFLKVVVGREDFSIMDTFQKINDLNTLCMVRY